MSSRFDKTDGAGNIIKPGDVCVRYRSGKLEYIVFKRGVWGGRLSRGEFGRFITDDGFSSIKYRNVLFAFDPMSLRRAEVGIKKLTRMFYERGRL